MQRIGRNIPLSAVIMAASSFHDDFADVVLPALLLACGAIAIHQIVNIFPGTGEYLTTRA